MKPRPFDRPQRATGTVPGCSHAMISRAVMTHTSGRTSEWTLTRRHFSDERLHLYLVEAQGDADAAARLYQWNSRCSAVIWEALGYLEVSLRNALDARMTLRQRNRGQPRHWTFDDTRQLGRDSREAGCHAHPYQDIAAAIRRVQANNKPLDPAQIISELPVGFWHQLVARRQMFLWPDLAAAFNHAPTRSPVPVRERLVLMRDLRNRATSSYLYFLFLPLPVVPTVTRCSYTYSGRSE